jgi:hypothetical protein
LKKLRKFRYFKKSCENSKFLNKYAKTQIFACGGILGQKQDAGHFPT